MIIIVRGNDLLIIHFIVFVNILFSGCVLPLGILVRLVRFVFCLLGFFFFGFVLFFRFVLFLFFSLGSEYLTAERGNEIRNCVYRA